MSVTIPYLVAEGATAAAIDKGSTPTDKLARAKTASSVAAFLQAASQSDFVSINAEVSTLIGTLEAKDAALAQFAADVWSMGQPFVQVNSAVVTNIPALGGSISNALTELGKGAAAAAGAAITQYSPKT